MQDYARNEVALTGRVAAPAQERALPSGDTLVSWRLVIDRPPPALPPARRVPTVDTVDCVTFLARARRTVLTFEAGDVVHVEGALRRRFWRAGATAASRCEVEAAVVRRLARGQASR